MEEDIQIEEGSEVIHRISIGFLERHVFREAAILEWVYSPSGCMQSRISFRPRTWRLLHQQSVTSELSQLMQRVKHVLVDVKDHDVLCKPTIIPVAWTKPFLPRIIINDVFARMGRLMHDIQHLTEQYWWLDCLELDVQAQQFRGYINGKLFVNLPIGDISDQLSDDLQIKVMKNRTEFSATEHEPRTYMMMKHPLITWIHKQRKRKSS